MPSLVDLAASRIAEVTAPQSQQTAVKWRWGTVEAVNADGTMDVDIAGSTVPSVTALASATSAAAGDRVRVDYLGTDAVVTGVAANEASVAVETLYDSNSITIRRSGRTIMVQAHGVSCTPSTSTAVLANVLTNYKPDYNISTTVLTSSGGSTQAARMVVYASNGGVYIVPAGYSSSASWYGTLTYIY